MSESPETWLKEVWKDKARGWKEAARLYAETAVALLWARLFTARELRRLENRVTGRRRSEESVVLRLSGRWTALLEKVGLRPSCLVRSLALARVLRMEGYDARLVFGVRSDNGEREGHCWVAVGERSVTEAPASFKELRNE